MLKTKSVRDIIIERLREAVEYIEAGCSSDEFNDKFCEFSPDGDGWGSENYFIQFGGGHDIVEALEYAERQDQIIKEFY